MIAPIHSIFGYYIISPIWTTISIFLLYEVDLKFAIIWDSGSNISSIKRELQVQGAEEIHIDHITCTTDRGDQDLGYEITFGSPDTNFIEKMLKCYHGYICADNST